MVVLTCPIISYSTNKCIVVIYIYIIHTDNFHATPALQQAEKTPDKWAHESTVRHFLEHVQHLFSVSWLHKARS